jgi:hypothetical protein
MSKREAIARELDQLPEPDLDRLLGFLHVLKQEHADDRWTMLAAESSLAKDWLTPEEDDASAHL